MMPNWKTLHKDFKLNGFSYSKEELEDLAYDFVKEGTKHERAIGNFLQDWLDENEAIRVNTSGSTGKPKEIFLKKEHMVNSAVATGNFFDLQPGNTALLCLSSNFIAGKMMLVRAMILGLELDYVEPSSSPLGGTLKNYDFCAMVPMQLENSLDKIDRIKTVIVGGAAVSSVLKSKIQNTDCQIFETYGMTETITHVAVKSVNNVRASPVEISFRALPDVRFSKDKRDCLIINAPKILDRPIKTNDVVDLISETRFEWLGRHDNVINSGGIKLFPEQIEAKLAKLISERFFVAGLPDKILGQILVLIVEGETDTTALIQEIVKLSSLERFEIPKNIYALSKFVETDTGKIRRKENINLIPG